MKRLALLLAVWLIAFPALALSPPVLAVVQPKVTNTVAWTGFSLTTLGAAVKAHWAAPDLASTPVATWTDDVSAIAATATGSAEPSWSATGFAGLDGSSHPGVIFDGVANTLVSLSFAALPVGATAGEIWALVDQKLVAPVAGGVALRYGGNNGVSRSVGMGRNNNIPSFAVSDGSSGLIDAVTFFYGPSVISGSFSGTTAGGTVNGSPFNPATATIPTLNTGATRLRLGATTPVTPAQFLNGVISDVIVTTTLTTTQRAQLGAWLAWRGGAQSRLAYNNPYRTRQP